MAWAVSKRGSRFPCAMVRQRSPARRAWLFRVWLLRAIVARASPAQSRLLDTAGTADAQRPSPEAQGRDMEPANESDPRLSMLETMMTIRAYEQKLVAINAQTGAAGTCTSVGQEAGAVGVVRALERRDRIVTNHRSAGHLLARGADAG